MTNEEAFNEIRNWVDYDGVGKINIVALNLACDALRKCEEYKWISAKDHMPPDDFTEVILTDGESCYTGFWREDAHDWDNINQGWVHCGVDKNGIGIQAKITHWMKEPELPK
jgi:hypothetical protein